MYVLPFNWESEAVKLMATRWMLLVVQANKMLFQK